jgi:acyl carrier protein
MHDFEDFTSPAEMYFVDDYITDDEMDDFATGIVEKMPKSKLSLSAFDTTSVESSVRDILIDFAGIKERTYTRDSLLAEDMGLDSLDRVELVMMCEANFGISLPDHEWAGVETAGDLVELIRNKLRSAR